MGGAELNPHLKLLMLLLISIQCLVKRQLDHTMCISAEDGGPGHVQQSNLVSHKSQDTGHPLSAYLNANEVPRSFMGENLDDLEIDSAGSSVGSLRSNDALYYLFNKTVRQHLGTLMGTSMV